MALDRLDALETRIKDLVKLIQELKKRNASLEDDLRLMRQRLADIGGECVVRSQPGSGTAVSLKIRLDPNPARKA